jgi:zinc D-Ala-D-Ala carboxypeptidase
MKKVIALLALVILIIGAVSWAKVHDSKDNSSGSQQKNTAFNKNKFSKTDPSSLWVIVNKTRPLPNSYAPSHLVNPNTVLRLPASDPEMTIRPETSTAFEQLVKGAKTAGYDLMLGSGYRSYQLQTIVYNGEVQQFGQAKADSESARPGTSEHQTGLALDVDRTDRQCEFEQCFGDLPEGKWIVANAYKYGFILRYQKDKTAITGYNYDPWHLRYVGIDLSNEMHRTGISTLEEFFK